MSGFDSSQVFWTQQNLSGAETRSGADTSLGLARIQGRFRQFLKGVAEAYAAVRLLLTTLFSLV
jgi:hypothetical protein